MHVLLRNAQTGEYFAGANKWVADAAKAKDFRQLESAVRTAIRQKAGRAELVLRLANLGEEVVLTVGGGPGHILHIEAARLVMPRNPGAFNFSGSVTGTGRKAAPPPGSAAGKRQPGRGKSALTVRESEILELIGQGMSYKEAADRLKVSVNTVSNHLANARQKLGAHSVIEALLLAGWR